MRTKSILAIILCIAVASCVNNNPTSHPADVDSLSVDTTKVDSLDELSRIAVPTNDNIEFLCDSIIGDLHIRHYTRNDSTATLGQPSSPSDTRTLPYARKACLFVCDGNTVYQKEITRAELQKNITSKENIEEFQISSINAETIDDAALQFKVAMKKEDALYLYEFEYEYRKGEFTLNGTAMYDAESNEKMPM